MSRRSETHRGDEPTTTTGVPQPDEGLIEVWNLHDGATAVTGAQEAFNVVGHVPAGTVRRMTYVLNAGPSRPVYVRRHASGPDRLERPGDFSIDTIDCAALAPQNTLALRAELEGAQPVTRTIRFSTRPVATVPPGFQPGLQQVRHIEEVGQVIDGRWRVARDRWGPCIRLSPQDGGYDRVILLARVEDTRDFEAAVTLCVDRWLSARHNVGLVFDWHGHRRGDGTTLPRQWTTGLAYYCSKGRGLRLRAGVDVHNLGPRERRGDVVLCEAPLSRWRHLASRLSRRLPVPGIGFPQLRAGVPYRLVLRVEDGRHTLTAWDSRGGRCATVSAAPPALLPAGAIGVIAHRCGVTISELTVAPL